MAVVAAALGVGTAHAADASAGATRFATPPQTGLLACIDCHSDNPQLNNFGNIWSGRNAVALIQRAVNANTGGMGYFNQFYSAADYANIAAFLGNTPASLSFASTALGQTSAAQTVTVSSSTKTGFNALTVSVEGDFVIVADGCGSSVARFSSCTVDVAFRPSGEGTRSGALLLAHDGTPTPVRIALSGEGPRRPKAVATLLPASLNFAAQPLGGEGMQRLVALANNSPETLTLGSISTSADFVLAGGSCISGAALRSGQRCVLALRFTPTVLGPISGQLSVLHDGVDGRSLVALSGSAVAALALLGSDTDSVDFGHVAPGAAASARVVQLINHGSAALTLRDSGVSDAVFSVGASSCLAGTVLAAQQRCQVSLSFQPGREAAFSGEWRATSTDGAVLRVPLAGRGATVAAAAVPARLALSEVLGQTRRRDITLVNRGSLTWQLRSLALSGPEAADFNINLSGSSCQLGKVLAAGSSCTVAVSFTPRAPGARLARLLLAHDAASAPVAVELFGQGLATPQAELWLDAALLDFGAAPVGASAGTRSLNLGNQGRAALNWQHIALVGEHAADFNLGGDCRVTSALAAGERCGVTLRFSPRGSALRSATLVLWPQGAAEPALVSLSGRGAPGAASGPPPAQGGALAAALPELQATPALLAFAARSGQSAPSQRLWLRNVGAASLRVDALGLLGSGFAFSAVSSNSACGVDGFELLPGDACALDVAWTGNAAAAAGATLSATGPAPLAQAAVPLSVTEDPAQQSNIGTGGGSTSPLALLALCIALLAMARTKSRHD